ncbi:hypothetical protein [Streptomyces sp. NPDC015131]|uniref:hypothetical protein n=1 Tax=Streptomyces sp. NPDC015131 TaxID=3364941 RepID=UPI0036F5B4EC
MTADAERAAAPGTDTAAAGAAVGGRTPAGTWTARVARPGGTYTSVLHFTVDGRVFLDSGGAGTWWATAGEGAFAFRIAEPVLDGGACAGWVDVEQRAVLSGDGGAFGGEGTSVVYGADGARRRVARVGIAARARRPGVPPA